MKLDALAELRRIDARARRMSRVSAVLQWDQETYLPAGAVEERAEQISDIEGLAHERFTDPRVGELLESLGSSAGNPSGAESLPFADRAFLRALRRDYDRRTKLPRDFVEAVARDQGLSQAAWVAARKANDFSAFAPHLHRMVEHAKTRAAFYGFSSNAYDGLIDEYEPGMTEARLSALFTPLAAGLSSLLSRIASRPQPRLDFLHRNYPISVQEVFCERMMDDLRYDRSRGRLDRSAHPFTTTLGADDVRITTRYFADNPLSGLYSVIHETGHALYEQGYGPDIRGSCLADGASMGIHESQSRFWENIVGRSRSFWERYFEPFKLMFPACLDGVDIDSFYRAVNAVRPSLIRVDADEVSYSLHIILRFDLERRIFSGELSVPDLPEAWRDGMRSLLGVVPDTDADGVMQDVHWSMGAFGYFPSYALGNIYGAMFVQAMTADFGDIGSHIAKGDFETLLEWLRGRIHRIGRSLFPDEILFEICGTPADAMPFLRYLETKYSAIYAF